MMTTMLAMTSEIKETKIAQSTMILVISVPALLMRIVEIWRHKTG